MSQTTAWSHLPNAAHIDRVLADLRERPQAWDTAWNAALDDAWNAAMGTVTAAAARHPAGAVALAAAWYAAWYAAGPAARGAVAALVAWDDAGEYLEFSPERLRALSELGDHKALLLLSAVLAMQSEPVDQ